MSTIGTFQPKGETTVGNNAADTTTVAADTTATNTAIDTTVVNDTATADTAVVPENETTVDAPAFFKPDDMVADTTTTTSVADNDTKPATSWKDLIKAVDKAELLKEAGLSPFAIEMDAHIKGGGNPIDYLNAKAVDYTQFSDMDIVKSDLKKQFPSFSNDEIDRLVNKKYSLTGEAEDDADGLLLLKADAHTKRQIFIQEQSKFKIAEQQQVQVQEEQVQPTAQELALQRRQYVQSLAKQLKETDPSTKALMETKRVSVALGDDAVHNFNVNPDFVVDAITNPDTWRRIISLNPQEADIENLKADPAKLQRAVVMLTNPNYEKDIYNSGKSAGRKELISEGQNAVRGVQQVAESATNESLGKAFSHAKKSTIGNLQQN